MKLSYRSPIKLDGFWKFKPDKDHQGVRQKWYTGLTDHDVIGVPASYNGQVPEYKWHMGWSWYEKEVFVDRSFSKGAAWLQFEGVNYIARVWVNGKYVGRHEGGFTPFRLNVTSALAYNALNTVTVLVDNTLSPDTIPPGEHMNETCFDFFHYGGIQRDVSLEFTPEIFIDDVEINTKIRGKDATVAVTITMRNAAGSARGAAALSCEITNSARETLSARREKIGAQTRKRVTFDFELDEPSLWSPESPTLYLAKVQLKSAGKSDAVEERFGIREIAVKEDGLYLNGSKIFLKGFGRHEDFPVLGKGANSAVVRKDFQLLQDSGSNVYRSVHYPYDRANVELADEMGILVLQELPNVTLDEPQMASRDYLRRSTKMMKEMINRDKNSPAVIAWIAGNEWHSYKECAAPFFSALKGQAKKQDPSRPVFFVSMYGAQCTVGGMSDVVCRNMYPGWYSQFGDIDAAAVALSDELDSLWTQFNKPVLLSEFGAGAIAGAHSDPPEMWSEEYQAEVIERMWHVAVSKPYVIGAIIWGLVEFLTPQSPTRAFVHRKGIFTRTRDPKLAAGTVKRLFSGLET